MKFKHLLFILLISNLAAGQSILSEHFGASLGLVVNIGTHNNSYGLNINTYYKDYNYQFNAIAGYHWYYKNIGNRNKFHELRLGTGLILLAGKKESSVDLLLDGLNHQTAFDYGVGYNFLWYIDNVNTSQHSGGWAIHVKNTSIYLENDVFAGQAKDRFRTAHLQVAHRTDELRIAAGINIWTGETRNSLWEKVAMEKCPSGYRILENLPYGRQSHGIAYGEIRYFLPQSQHVHLKLGIDSEHIRHAIQNRFVHDLIFLPKKIERTTPHYPRLDEHGCAVFEKENVRKNLFFIQYGANDYWSN